MILLENNEAFFFIVKERKAERFGNLICLLKYFEVNEDEDSIYASIEDTDSNSSSTIEET